LQSPHWQKGGRKEGGAGTPIEKRETRGPRGEDCRALPKNPNEARSRGNLKVNQVKHSSREVHRGGAGRSRAELDVIEIGKRRKRYFR